MIWLLSREDRLDRHLWVVNVTFRLHCDMYTTVVAVNIELQIQDVPVGAKVDIGRPLHSAINKTPEMLSHHTLRPFYVNIRSGKLKSRYYTPERSWAFHYYIPEPTGSLLYSGANGLATIFRNSRGLATIFQGGHGSLIFTLLARVSW